MYQKGNPQLRIFLPNFWLKIIKPVHKQPENVVQLHCSMEMTRLDVRNYLEKIYNVSPVHVRIRIGLGKTRICPKQHCVIKDDDKKIAYVVLVSGSELTTGKVTPLTLQYSLGLQPVDQPFAYPELFPPTSEKSTEDRFEEYKSEYKQYVKSNTMPGLPTWFRV